MPDYHTVITSTQYKDVMGDYTDFLGTLETTSQRRGSATITETKSEIAERFGLRQTSSFDGRIRKHYADILTVENDDADEYKVRAVLHPLEDDIIEKVESQDGDGLALTAVEDLALREGYRDEEVTVIFDFMQKRGIVGMNDERTALVISETNVTIDDVEQTLSDCRDRIDTIASLDADRIPDNATDTLDAIEAELDDTHPEDGEKLETMQVEATHVRDRLDETSELLHAHYKSTCEDVKTNAERTHRSLIPDHLDEDVTGGVQFVGGLNDARTDLLSEFRDLKTSVSGMIEETEEVLREHDTASLENATALHAHAEAARNTLDDIEDRADDLDSYADELKRWRTFTDKAGNVKSDIRDYSRTFDESISEESRIEDFIGQVAERLAADPLDALTNLEVFEERLTDIEESYQERREERREVFDAKQETLNTLLKDATDGRAGRLRETFDVKQPDESRRRLLEDFKDEYESQVLDRVADLLGTARNEVEYASIVGVEAETDAKPERVEEEIDHAEAELRNLRGTLSRFEFSDIGEQAALSGDGSDLLSTAESLQDDARAFRAQTDPDDEAIQDLLSRVEDRRGVDFKELLMGYHDDETPIEVDELLDRIEQLFKLNQVDITIEPRRRRR